MKKLGATPAEELRGYQQKGTKRCAQGQHQAQITSKRARKNSKKATNKKQTKSTTGKQERARYMAQERAKRLWLPFYCTFWTESYSKARLVFRLCLCFSQIHIFCCGCVCFFARQISQEWCTPECWKLADSCRQCCWLWWSTGFRNATDISFICKFHLYGTQFVSVWQYTSLTPHPHPTSK